MNSRYVRTIHWCSVRWWSVAMTVGITTFPSTQAAWWDFQFRQIWWCSWLEDQASAVGYTWVSSSGQIFRFDGIATLRRRITILVSDEVFNP